MAAASTQQLTSFTNISPKNLSSDIRAGKHDYRLAEKLYEESPSTFSQISSEICNSRIESRSPNNGYVSWCSISEPKSARSIKNGEIADGDSVHTKLSDGTKYSSTRAPVVRKSRVSAYLSGTESGVSDHEQSVRGKRSETPRNKMIDLHGKCITPASDNCVQSPGGALDFSQCFYNNSKTSFQPEKGERQKSDGNKQTLLSDFESRSQECDVPQAKHSYYSNSQSTGDKEGKGTNANLSRTTLASTRHSNHTLHYNVSELALKLRGSMESEFLSNELRKQDSSPLEDTNADPKETYRTVDEILRHYGITSVVPSSQYKKVVYNNISQNNETSQSLEMSDSGKKRDTISSKPREASSQPKTLSKANMDTSGRKEPRINPPLYLDNRNAKMPGITYKINLSQNNETKYGTTHQDLLRKYGSSVDYSSIAAGGKYSATSTSNNFGRYDYGKSAFPGDVVSAAQTYANTKVPDFEVKKSNLLSRQLEGSQVDILKPTDMAVSKGDDFNSIRHTGSSIDAVEFTISNERQRLRRLNNMITSTSVTTSDPIAHKSLMTRYLSPQRDYESMRASNVISKVYSSPTVPSSHYGTSVTPKSNWAESSTGQHDTSIFMGRSASVPNTWNNGFQTVTNYSTSVDSRSPYMPHYSSRDFDYQFNNSTYRSFSMERLASHINSSKNHARSFLNRRQESPFRRTIKQGILTSTKHPNYNQSRCPLKNVSNLSMFSTKSDASYTTKSESSNHVSRKQMANRNINDSKSTSEIHRSLGNPKNINKVSRSDQQMKTPPSKAGHKQHGSHTSNPPGKVQKVETFHNLANELFKNESNQASTKSKHARSGARKANSPVDHSRKPQGRGRDSGVFPSRKARGSCHAQPSMALYDTNQRILRSAEKKKERMASEILIQKINAMPKSIHKHNNHLSGNMSGVYRPHSPHATSSRSYPQFSSTRQPYHVYGDFSTTNFYSTGPSYF